MQNVGVRVYPVVCDALAVHVNVLHPMGPETGERNGQRALACFRVSVSCFRFRVPGFGFQFSGLGFRVSGFECRVSDFGSQI